MKVLGNQSGKFDFSNISKATTEEHGNVAFRPEPITPDPSPVSAVDTTIITSPVQSEPDPAAAPASTKSTSATKTGTATKGAAK